MIFVATLLFVFHTFLFSDSVLLFKSRYERLNLDFIRKLPSTSSIGEERFQQKLDHFNPTDTRTWEQLYFTENSYYKRGGPVYLWISGESSATPGWLLGGYWQDHGRTNQALLFLIEHRFYGRSQPFRDTSTDHLRYLSTHQALADLASFIISMNKKYELPENTKWIVFGGSYAGNLAAWMRLKYPHLVHGAVASSAPVLAQLDFPQYFDVVSNALVTYKKQCREDIAKANKELDRKVRTHDGRKIIGEMFKLCSPLQGHKLDKAYFLSSMADYFAGSVQYDRNGSKVKRACNKMLEGAENSDPVERYANLMNMFMKDYGESCLPTNFTNYLENLKKEDILSSTKTYRPWIYQTCTEYGYYQTTRRKHYTFSKRISLDFYQSLCTKVFKPLFEKPFISNAVDDTNKFFGGLKINSSRLISVHGLLDPWHPLGITSAKNTKNIDVVLIKGASHCNDLRFPQESDSDEIRNARTKVMNLLDKWLNEK